MTDAVAALPAGKGGKKRTGGGAKANGGGAGGLCGGAILVLLP